MEHSFEDIYEKFSKFVSEEYGKNYELDFLQTALLIFKFRLKKEPDKLYNPETCKQIALLCPICGEKLVENANFCYNCGQAIRRGIM